MSHAGNDLIIEQQKEMIISLKDDLDKVETMLAQAIDRYDLAENKLHRRNMQIKDLKAKIELQNKVICDIDKIASNNYEFKTPIGRIHQIIDKVC